MGSYFGTAGVTSRGRCSAMKILFAIVLLSCIILSESRRRRVRAEDTAAVRRQGLGPGHCRNNAQCWSRQLSVRRRPTKLKLMCNPSWRQIRCRMVSVGKWQEREVAKHRLLHRTRIKRKPRKKRITPHSVSSWSSWKEKRTVKQEEKVPDDQWKPLSPHKRHKGPAQTALKEIKNEIRKQNLKQKVEQQSKKPLVNNKQLSKGTLSQEERPLQGQMVRFGEEGKILTVKGAQISIFPTTKSQRDSRMFFI